VGVTGGRYRFSVTVLEQLKPTSTSTAPELDSTPAVRVGVSRTPTAVAMLGDEPLSWAYASNARKCGGGVLVPFGAPGFRVGDRVTACVDLTAGGAGTLSFAVNGRWQGEAFRLPAAQSISGAALWPHILVRNMVVRVDFSGAHAPQPLPHQAASYRPWQLAASVPVQCQITPLPPPPAQRRDVLILVGLPGSGKSTWAAKFARDHSEYTVLGIDTALEQMRVLGVSKQRAGRERWAVLSTLASALFEAQVARAATQPRFYVIDQSSVSEAVLRARAAPFRPMAFRRVAGLLVQPDQELFRRQGLQAAQEGKVLPEHTILQMRASFVVPRVGPEWDEVVFLEAPQPAATAILAAMRPQAQAALNLLTAGKRPLPGDAATAATAPPAQRQRVDGGGPGAASTSQAGAQPDERSRGGAGIWVPGPGGVVPKQGRGADSTSGQPSSKQAAQPFSLFSARPAAQSSQSLPWQPPSSGQGRPPVKPNPAVPVKQEGHLASASGTLTGSAPSWGGSSSAPPNGPAQQRDWQPPAAQQWQPPHQAGGNSGPSATGQSAPWQTKPAPAGIPSHPIQSQSQHSQLQTSQAQQSQYSAKPQQSLASQQQQQQQGPQSEVPPRSAAQSAEALAHWAARRQPVTEQRPSQAAPRQQGTSDRQAGTSTAPGVAVTTQQQQPQGQEQQGQGLQQGQGVSGNWGGGGSGSGGAAASQQTSRYGSWAPQQPRQQQPQPGGVSAQSTRGFVQQRSSQQTASAGQTLLSTDRQQGASQMQQGSYQYPPAVQTSQAGQQTQLSSQYTYQAAQMSQGPQGSQQAYQYPPSAQTSQASQQPQQGYQYPSSGQDSQAAQSSQQTFDYSAYYSGYSPKAVDTPQKVTPLAAAAAVPNNTASGTTWGQSASTSQYGQQVPYGQHQAWYGQQQKTQGQQPSRYGQGTSYGSQTVASAATSQPATEQGLQQQQTAATQQNNWQQPAAQVGGLAGHQQSGYEQGIHQQNGYQQVSYHQLNRQASYGFEGGVTGNATAVPATGQSQSGQPEASSQPPLPVETHDANGTLGGSATDAVRLAAWLQQNGSQPAAAAAAAAAAYPTEQQAAQSTANPSAEAALSGTAQTAEAAVVYDPATYMTYAQQYGQAYADQYYAYCQQHYQQQQQQTTTTTGQATGAAASEAPSAQLASVQPVTPGMQGAADPQPTYGQTGYGQTQEAAAMYGQKGPSQTGGTTGSVYDQSVLAAPTAGSAYRPGYDQLGSGQTGGGTQPAAQATAATQYGGYGTAQTAWQQLTTGLQGSYDPSQQQTQPPQQQAYTAQNSSQQQFGMQNALPQQQQQQYGTQTSQQQPAGVQPYQAVAAGAQHGASTGVGGMAGTTASQQLPAQGQGATEQYGSYYGQQAGPASQTGWGAHGQAQAQPQVVAGTQQSAQQQPPHQQQPPQAPPVAGATYGGAPPTAGPAPAGGAGSQGYAPQAYQSHIYDAQTYTTTSCPGGSIGSSASGLTPSGATGSAPTGGAAAKPQAAQWSAYSEDHLQQKYQQQHQQQQTPPHQQHPHGYPQAAAGNQSLAAPAVPKAAPAGPPPQPRPPQHPPRRPAAPSPAAGAVPGGFRAQGARPTAATAPPAGPPPQPRPPSFPPKPPPTGGLLSVVGGVRPAALAVAQRGPVPPARPPATPPRPLGGAAPAQQWTAPAAGALKPSGVGPPGGPKPPLAPPRPPGPRPGAAAPQPWQQAPGPGISQYGNGYRGQPATPATLAPPSTVAAAGHRPTGVSPGARLPISAPSMGGWMGRPMGFSGPAPVPPRPSVPGQPSRPWGY